MSSNISGDLFHISGAESKALASRREATDLADIVEYDDEVDVDEDDR